MCDRSRTPRSFESSRLDRSRPGLRLPLWWRTIPNSERGHRFSYSRLTVLVTRCMWSGAFRGATQGLRFW